MTLNAKSEPAAQRLAGGHRVSGRVENTTAARRQPNEVITVVVPQFVPRRQWHQALHAQTAMMLRLALVFEPGVVITSVPYQVAREEEEE